MKSSKSLDRELDILYYSLSSIGFRVSHGLKSTQKQNSSIDIESVLVKSLFYMDLDGRLFSLVVSWLDVHGSHLVFDKFLKKYKKESRERGEKSPWFNAVCSFMSKVKKDHRFSKHTSRLAKDHHFGGRDQSSLIALKGEIDWLSEVGIKMARTSLRLRRSDIESIDDLISKNLQYRNRFIFGANWRSEIITKIQQGNCSTPASIARELGISRSRVGSVFGDYMKLKVARRYSLGYES